MTQARDIIDAAPATGMNAMRTTVATTLDSTSGTLAFSSAMFLHVLLVIDWKNIAGCRERFDRENLCRANERHTIQYEYVPNQQVLKKVYDPTKLRVRTSGPYTFQ